MFVSDTTGLQRKLKNYLYLEHEVISYSGVSGNMLLNVERGLLGTEAVRHPAGSLVAQAMRMKAVVVRVDGNRITLDRQSAFRVENADVRIGSFGMSIQGLTLNGNRRPEGAEGVATVAVRYELARWATVRGSTFKRGPHGGISLDQGTTDSVIEDNDFFDNGDVINTSGASIWLFRGPERNVVRRNRIAGQTYAGIVVDDRSVSSTEFDAYGAWNEVYGNTIDIARFPPHRNAGVVIDGANGCRVLNNTIRNSATGVIVSRVTQGTRPSIAQSNVVIGNILVGHRMGIDVSGSDNEFVRNEIRGSQHAWKDTGLRNRFIDNEVQS